MDELSLHLSSTSIKERRTGQGTAHLRHAGMKGSQATVILATTASGKLLPPLLILKVIVVDVKTALTILLFVLDKAWSSCKAENSNLGGGEFKPPADSCIFLLDQNKNKIEDRQFFLLQSSFLRTHGYY